MPTSTRLFWSDMTDVLVGPSQKKFVFHTAVLKQIPFMQKCLDAPMKESQEGVVKLPEDDPLAFAEVAYWAYYGRFEQDVGSTAEGYYKKPTDRAMSQVHEQTAIRLKTYLLAKKMMYEELQNSTVDSLRAAYKWVMPGSQSLAFVHDNFESDDCLRSYVTRLLAYNIHQVGGWKAWKEKHAVCYNNFMQRNVDHLEWALEAVTRYQKNMPNPSKALPACLWHVHVITPRCP